MDRFSAQPDSTTFSPFGSVAPRMRPPLTPAPANSAVDAKRLCGDVKLGTVIGGNGLSLDEHHSSLHRALHVVYHGSLFVSRNQSPAGLIRSVDEGFARERDAGARRGATHFAAGESEQRQGCLYFTNRRDDRSRRLGITRGPIVEGAVWLHIRESRPLRSTHVTQSADLVLHVKLDLFGRKAELASSEARDVGIRRVRADRYAAKLRSPHRVPHRRRVTGVKAARNVRRRDEVEQCFVFRGSRSAEAFAQVSIQINCEGQVAISCGLSSRR